MNIKLADRLVELRKENKLSQEALAEKLGLSRQSISKWERAEASPDTDNLIALAELYQISLDELLGNEPANTEEKTAEKRENAKEKREKKALTQKQLKGKKILSTVPIFLVLAVAIYVGVGLLTGGAWWALMWVLFPLVVGLAFWGLSLLAEHIKALSVFCGALAVTLAAASIFAALGIQFGLWRIAWLVFLIIPVYIYLSVIKK